MKVILYSRVSTNDQSTAAQIMELRSQAALRKWTVVGEHEDVISGSTKSRPQLDAMLARVALGGIDAVVCVKIDRLGRSLSNLVELIAKLRSHKCAIICTSQGIDTSSTNPCGELLANLLGCIAQFERALIQERTKAGMAVAKAAGKTIGRPSQRMVAEPERGRIIGEWKAAGGRGYRELGVLLGGVSGATAMRVAKKVGTGKPIEDWEN